MRKPLAITTPTHAVAVSVYVAQAALAVAYTLGFPVSPSLTAVLGILWGTTWALGTIGAATACTVAVFYARRSPLPALTMELAGTLTLAAASVVYGWAIFAAGNADKSLTTLGYAGMVAVGCTARAAQIIRERRKIRAALTATATTEVTADPSGE